MKHNSAPELHDAVEQQGTELAEELDLVEKSLRSMLESLQSPFNQFVAGQMQRIYPLARAAVVLTCGLSAADNANLRRQRIDLAAAQELLFLALRIHMRLVGQTVTTGDLNRSLLGSTILAGDFCFSRSAELAVHTGNATVVEIFAETLKRVSEGHLRLLFNPGSIPFDEIGELFGAGAHAAGVLAGLAPATLAAARAQSLSLAAVYSRESNEYKLDKSLTDKLSLSQLGRWHALIVWLQAASA